MNVNGGPTNLNLTCSGFSLHHTLGFSYFYLIRSTPRRDLNQMRGWQWISALGSCQFSRLLLRFAITSRLNDFPSAQASGAYQNILNFPLPVRANGLKIGEPTTFGMVICMAHAISNLGTFLTNGAFLHWRGCLSQIIFHSRHNIRKG
jgi:hypothetical protein